MWNLYSNEREGFWEIYDENKNIVALINQKNINKNSKFNTSLILNSKDLYEFVNSIKDLQLPILDCRIMQSTGKYKNSGKLIAQLVKALKIK